MQFLYPEGFLKSAIGLSTKISGCIVTIVEILKRLHNKNFRNLHQKLLDAPDVTVCGTPCRPSDRMRNGRILCNNILKCCITKIPQEI